MLVRGEEDDRLEDDWQPVEDTRAPEEIEKSVRKTEAESRAVVLEMIGDLPDAEARPDENLIFVCKLNPVTSEEDLEIIFSRFGKVTTCDVIKDWKTGESLCYAFVGFETKEAAEQAYFKMDNVVIDDRRIHVDFYQSMYHQWRMYKRTGKPPPAHPAHPHKGHGSPQEEGMVMPRRRQEQQYADRHPRQQSHQSHQGHHLSRGEGGSRELGSEHAPRDRRERRRERSPERERQHRHRHKHRRERSSRRERHGNERRSSEHRSHKRHRSSEDRERYSRQTERRH